MNSKNSLPFAFPLGGSKNCGPVGLQIYVQHRHHWAAELVLPAPHQVELVFETSFRKAVTKWPSPIEAELNPANRYYG